MTDKELIKLYKALDRRQELRALTRLAHRMTIEARGTYIPETEAIADPVRLRRFNELQHRITARLAELAAEDKSGWEIESFATYLIAACRELGCAAIVPELLRPPARSAKHRAVA